MDKWSSGKFWSVSCTVLWTPVALDSRLFFNPRCNQLLSLSHLLSSVAWNGPVQTHHLNLDLVQGLFWGRPKLRDPKYKATFLTEDWASFSSPFQALETYIRNPTWQLPSYSHSSVRPQCPWAQSPDAPHSAGGLSVASISGEVSESGKQTPSFTRHHGC